MSNQTQATMLRPGRSSTTSSVSSTSSGSWLELTSAHRSPESSSEEGASTPSCPSSFLELSVAASANKAARAPPINEESKRLFLLRARDN